MAKGDHIYVFSVTGGIPYQHHGIDMGDGTVIHLAPAKGTRLTLRDDRREFTIRRDPLENFCGGTNPTVVSHQDARDAEEVTSTAKAYLGKTGYSLLEGNCEHFATLCATGRSESHQIEMAEATVSALASMAVKAIGSVSKRIGAKLAVSSAMKVHPAAMLADGVEVAALAASCHGGLSSGRARRIARVSGSLAAAGIGGLLGGPAGAAACLATHTSSTAVADRVCKMVRQALS